MKDSWLSSVQSIPGTPGFNSAILSLSIFFLTPESEIAAASLQVHSCCLHSFETAHRNKQKKSPSATRQLDSSATSLPPTKRKYFTFSSAPVVFVLMSVRQSTTVGDIFLRFHPPVVGETECSPFTQTFSRKQTCVAPAFRSCDKPPVPSQLSVKHASQGDTNLLSWCVPTIDLPTTRLVGQPTDPLTPVHLGTVAAFSNKKNQQISESSDHQWIWLRSNR